MEEISDWMAWTLDAIAHGYLLSVRDALTDDRDRWVVERLTEEHFDHLIVTAQKRLGRKADPATREIVHMLCRERYYRFPGLYKRPAPPTQASIDRLVEGGW